MILALHANEILLERSARYKRSSLFADKVSDKDFFIKLTPEHRRQPRRRRRRSGGLTQTFENGFSSPTTLGQN